jgi:16S rRNA processing protein RimM
MGAEEPGYLIVGSVQKPHGVKGELFVRLETDHPDVVFRQGRVLLLGDAAGRPAGGTLTVERARVFKGGLLLKVAEHSVRTDATDALRGRLLLIPEGDATPLEEDEVYYHQLIGLTVRAGETDVGRVRDVYEAPSGYLIGVEREGAKELLIPFVREMIKRVSVAEGVLEIEAPAGLLEL